MNCPRCNSALVARSYESDVQVDECPTCRGMWLDKCELERIQSIVVNDYSQQLAQPENTVAKSFEMARQKSRPPLACPNCGREMERTEAQAASMVLIDQCPSCGGKWLDFGEAQSLEQFVERLRREERQPPSLLASLKRLFR